MRTAEAARIADRDRLKAALADVEHDEDRLRANIAAVPANDALHTRLIRQLDASETRIAALTKEIEAGRRRRDRGAGGAGTGGAGVAVLMGGG